jgi:hypothetical protein
VAGPTSASTSSFVGSGIGENPNGSLAQENT